MQLAHRACESHIHFVDIVEPAEFKFLFIIIVELRMFFDAQRAHGNERREIDIWHNLFYCLRHRQPKHIVDFAQVPGGKRDKDNRKFETLRFVDSRHFHGIHIVGR